MYSFVVYLHVLSALTFVLFHGTAMGIMFKLRKERQPDKVKALLELSGQMTPASILALLMLLITGVVAAFMSSLWGEVWIWSALGLLIIISLAMSILGTEYYDKVRVALGLSRTHSRRGEVPRGNMAEAQELDRLLLSRKPVMIMAIGFVGLAAILWLMMFKPF